MIYKWFALCRQDIDLPCIQAGCLAQIKNSQLKAGYHHHRMPGMFSGLLKVNTYGKLNKRSTEESLCLEYLHCYDEFLANSGTTYYSMCTSLQKLHVCKNIVIQTKSRISKDCYHGQGYRVYRGLFLPKEEWWEEVQVLFQVSIHCNCDTSLWGLLNQSLHPQCQGHASRCYSLTSTVPGPC